MADMMD